MIRRSPSVWFAAEPFRPLYDLRHHANLANKQVLMHFYPKPDYERIRCSDLDVQLHVLENLDVKPEFDRLATNSVATARYLESVYGRRADRIAYPGINPRGETPPPSSFETVLHIGRMWRHKRIDLAKETAKATEEISRRIETIQQDTGSAVDAIGHIGSIISRIYEIQNAIASAVEEQTATSNEISRSVAEAAAGSAEIADNVSGVAETAQGTSAGATATQEATHRLSNMAGELHRLVSEFRY